MTTAKIDGVSVTTQANVYFDGGVISHTLIFADGSKKTLGLIRPGSYHFNTEAPERILDDAAEGVPAALREDPERYHRVADRALAVAAAIAACRPGALLLMAGKGHEPYQDVMGVKHPYRDREAATAVLPGRAVPRPWAVRP